MNQPSVTEIKPKRLHWGWWVTISLVIALLALVGAQLAVTQTRGVAVVGLAWSDTERESLKFINEFNQTYLSGPDLQTRAGDAYRVRAVPETHIIDGSGKLAWLKKGPTNFVELRVVLDELLR